MKYFILSFFFITSLYCRSQTISGFYNVKTFKTTEGRKMSSNESKPLIYTYIYNKEKSKQRLIAGGGIILKDTIITDSYGNQHDVSGSINKPSNVIIYKNLKDNTLEINFKSNNKSAAIKDSIPKHDWKLREDKKTILGFNCKKATTTSNYTGVEQNVIAWYAEDLAINDGPTVYNGLPGLILELEIDDKSIIRFEKIELLNNENVILEELDSFAPLTLEQYYTFYGKNN
jgi:GLPGLI family protein